MQLFVVIIFNLIFLQSHAVFMNGFQAITITAQSSLNLNCHETINETEISQTYWYQSFNGHLNELNTQEKSITISNISENSVFICQYTYYNYIYWFEIFLISIDSGNCPKNGSIEITTHQTVQYSSQQTEESSSQQTTKKRVSERMASQQPILSSGAMQSSVTFTFATCAICHAIFGFFYFKKNY